MSGPKVVRIVTREEVLSICEGQLARVETALAEWIRIGRRNDCVSDAEVTASTARVEALRNLMASDRFMDVQKRAPLEVLSLQDDMQARLLRKSDEAIAQRLQERRRTEAAVTLLRALAEKGRAISPELEARLRSADKSVAAKAMTEGFALLVDTPQSANDQKRALADRLKDGQDFRSLADWIAAQQTNAPDSTLIHLERQLGELAALGSTHITSFEERLKQVSQEDGGRRNLLVDSLQFDVAEELARLKEASRLALECAMAGAELKALGGTFDGVSSHKSTMDLQVQIDRLRGEIETRRTQLAAQARRSAILKSLTGLGYEVTAGLQTAWVVNGKVIVRKAVPPGYGVEISGSADLGRMQMRVVAFEGEAALDAVRDRDAETLWCGDVGKLERLLAGEGGGLVIERATPIGATAVKRVVGSAPSSSGEAHKARPAQTRSLK